MNNSKIWQDFEPVVLTKKKSQTFVSQQSKSNIHIDVKKDSDEIIPIIYYPQEKINIIKQAREAANLTQKELSKKIGACIPDDFIKKIESGNYPYNNKTYNRILQVLNIKNENKNKK
jgi:ribosome-binding protein aMBF1 (putative translation factor)